MIKLSVYAESDGLRPMAELENALSSVNADAFAAVQ